MAKFDVLGGEPRGGDERFRPLPILPDRWTLLALTDPGNDKNHAARVKDPHAAKGAPHEGPIETGSGDVKVNERPFARASDHVQCKCGHEDYVVTGAQTVLVNGQPAGRVSSKTLHKGEVIHGSPNVVVGGPDGGGVLGHPDEAERQCQELSTTRVRGTPHQNWNNCGMEAMRLLLSRAYGNAGQSFGYSEQGFFDLLGGGTNDDGGTTILDQNQYLNAFLGKLPGAPADASGSSRSTQPAQLVMLFDEAKGTSSFDPSPVVQMVADGKGVISGHEVGQLWGTDSTAAHAISPVGVRFDADGNVASVITVDTAGNSCLHEVPASTYFGSMRRWPAVNATSQPIWGTRVP